MNNENPKSETEAEFLQSALPNANSVSGAEIMRHAKPGCQACSGAGYFRWYPNVDRALLFKVGAGMDPRVPPAPKPLPRLIICACAQKRYLKAQKKLHKGLSVALKTGPVNDGGDSPA